ncbi:MAG: class I SAM-dependent methyltransferase [Prevotella sp.]|nr:class I SAM-dependent methyltransferase [Prevotella sp.]
MEKINKTDYGNWMPIKLVYIIVAGLILAAVLTFLTFHFSCHWTSKTLAIAFLIFMTISMVYALAVRHTFSFSGGGLMGKVHEYLTNHIQWDGNGKLLDVGCGAGALTIRCAKKFPQSECTGIDYWGMKWDYSKKMCENNAEIEGVADRCVFMKGDANNLDFDDETFDVVVSNFVYHEVNGILDRESLLKETLRVLKKGGVFALQDLFGQRLMYGDFNVIVEHLKSEGIEEINYIKDAGKEIPVPSWLRMPAMLNGVGIIYGKK